jgi:hypothetical protein
MWIYPKITLSQNENFCMQKQHKFHLIKVNEDFFFLFQLFVTNTTESLCIHISGMAVILVVISSHWIDLIILHSVHSNTSTSLSLPLILSIIQFCYTNWHTSLSCTLITFRILLNPNHFCVCITSTHFSSNNITNLYFTNVSLNWPLNISNLKAHNV